MITTNKMKSLMALLLAYVIVVPASMFSAITVDNVTGNWTNVQNGQNLTGVGTHQIFWGDTVGSQFRSGYSFDPQTPFFYNVNIDVPFNIATFTHFNGVIPIGSEITAAQLNMSVNLNVDGNPINNLNFAYTFNHNETPNVPGHCPPGSVSVCDDIVTLTNNPVQSDVFTIDGVQYTLKLLGFKINGNPVTSFMTQENKTNIALLDAVITRAAIQVPEPSTYLILGSALALCLFLQRKKLAKSAK